MNVVLTYLLFWYLEIYFLRCQIVFVSFKEYLFAIEN